MPDGTDAIRQLLVNHKFTLHDDGRWRHPDIRGWELVDIQITTGSLQQIRTLVRLVQNVPAVGNGSPYAPMGSQHTSKSGPGGRLMG